MKTSPPPEPGAPLVTVYTTTYNHEKYIAQTLESIVGQITDFRFQAVVIDDCSTDGTVGIIKQYAAWHPRLIRPILYPRNLGPGLSSREFLDQVETEYLAVCEGDDYWTDPCKLQKQIDFLRANPECSLCFHPVRVVFEDGSQPESIYPTPELRFYKERLILTDLMGPHNFIQNNSVVYRWRFRGPRSPLRSEMTPPNIMPPDWYLFMLHAEVGEIGFIDEVMAVYRRHDQSLMWNRKGDYWRKKGRAEINFYNALEEHFGLYRQDHVAYLARVIFKAYLEADDFDQARSLYEDYPGATAAGLLLRQEPHLESRLVVDFVRRLLSAYFRQGSLGRIRGLYERLFPFFDPALAGLTEAEGVLFVKTALAAYLSRHDFQGAALLGERYPKLRDQALREINTTAFTERQYVRILSGAYLNPETFNFHQALKLYEQYPQAFEALMGDMASAHFPRRSLLRLVKAGAAHYRRHNEPDKAAELIRRAQKAFDQLDLAQELLPISGQN